MQRTTTKNARKTDTREKIALGGLIVKAGLRFEKRALLLGAMIELAGGYGAPRHCVSLQDRHLRTKPVRFGEAAAKKAIRHRRPARKS
jgi:hypothetical protein